MKACLSMRRDTPAEFGVFLRAEIDKWGKVVREQNIQPE